MMGLGQEALDEMNRLLLNQQRLKMKLEKMDDKQIADLSKTIERLQKQLKEANSVIRKELRRQSPKGGVLLCDMYDYMEKWGIRR